MVCSRRSHANYRRARMPGATYFFTVNLHDRSSNLLLREIDLAP
jgi:putative transposase